MKGKDLLCFNIVVSISFIIGIFIFDNGFDGYSELITFLSIMICTEILSFSMIFNSLLRKKLWDAKNKYYKTELHRIKDYYKHSITFEIISIIVIFVFPNSLKIDLWIIHLGKQSVVFPVLIGSAYCLYVICKDLFRIFTFPTNK